MIRAIRPAAMAQDDATMVVGWNVAPNLAYLITVFPGATSCGVLVQTDGGALVASGAALTGSEQPCILMPQAGQNISMIDADLGWHLLLTTVGTESQRTIRIGPAVDLPDEIHPVYGADDLAVARATATIDAAAHYVDDVTVSCPLGIGAGLGDMVSVPVDGVAVVGQVESITWTGTPDGTGEQAVIRRHVAIAPGAFVEPVPPTPPDVADDEFATTRLESLSGNVLANDEPGLVVVAVDGLGQNVGQVVNGSAGGQFTINSDGAWLFNAAGDFDDLSVANPTRITSITYHVSNGVSESSATLRVEVGMGDLVTLVGTNTGSAKATTYNINLPEGLLQGDLVVVAFALIRGADHNMVMGSAGYTEVCDLYRADTRHANFSLAYKFMGATPDTVVSVGGYSGQAGCAIVKVFRGVQSFDKATTQTGQDGRYLTSPSIAPTSAGELIVTAGVTNVAAAQTGLDAMTLPTGYTEDGTVFIDKSGSWIMGLGMGFKIGGASESPGAWGGIVGDSSGDSWATVTAAFTLVGG